MSSSPIVLGGPALFLLGESLFVRRITGATNAKRLGAAVLLIALWPLGGALSVLELSVVVAALLSALAVWELSDARVGGKVPGLGCPPVPVLTLLHNPHCPTSVHALDALEDAGHDVTVRKYLLVAERLSEPELRSLAERLQGDPPDALIRRDKKYKELGLEADGLGIDEVVAILVEHPALLQRPILDDGTAAMIGRPRSRAAEWAAAGRVV